MNARLPAVERFRALHASGCFVLPNPCDVGTAWAFARLGFEALATTSAGVSFARGRPDALDSVTRDEMLAHVREIVGATELPVNADFQHGYAREPEGVAANVALCVATGVAGLSIEDASGHAEAPLFETELAVERIRAARAAIDRSGSGVVLTARCEAFFVGDPRAERTATERLVAYAEAGADCLYAPSVRDTAAIAALVRAVAPKPLNVLVPSPATTVAELAALGVRRVSLGSGLARVAWGALLRSAREIVEHGTFRSLADAAPFQELNELFASRPGAPRNTPSERFTFRVHPERLAVACLPRDAAVPSWATGEFLSITRTGDELSLVCAESKVPRELPQTRGRIALGIAGTLSMDSVGILAALCGALAAARVPVFALSTHDTDWLLVGAERFADACRALRSLGHAIEGDLPAQ